MLMRWSGQPGELTLEAVVFLVDLNGRYSRRCRVRRCPPPQWFEGRLPQAWLHQTPAANALRQFLQTWERAAEEVKPSLGQQPDLMRAWWTASVRRLAEWEAGVDVRREWVEAGWLVWHGALALPSILT
eukprot:GGOE01001265.1.p4 GENE.GGOE01001265.1~~GGOE01001265.1.p4  ORF type:complete len:129 (+),score=19.65 GGOE01001265.1:601-987(+)